MLVLDSGGITMTLPSEKLALHIVGPIDEETGEPMWEFWEYER